MFEQVKLILDQYHHQGVFPILIEEYRPEVSKMLADELDFDYFDLREELLKPLGWQAHEYKLDDLSVEFELRLSHKGIVAHNVEALLATKSSTERKSWINRLCTWQTLNPLLVPLVLYQQDIDQNTDRCIHIETSQLPEHKLLDWFVH